MISVNANAKKGRPSKSMAGLNCLFKFCDGNYRNEADLVIYFTHYRNEAGWRNEKKEHLMEE